MTKPMTKSKAIPQSAPPQVQKDHQVSSVVTIMPTQEDIARRAYKIYVKKGYQQDQSEQNWLQAERELNNQGPSVSPLRQ